MSDGLSYQFELTITSSGSAAGAQKDAGPNVQALDIEVTDRTGATRSAQRGALYTLKEIRLPQRFVLELNQSNRSAAELELKLCPTTPTALPDFEPMYATNDNVIAVQHALRDDEFDTQDDTCYVVRLTNQSSAYVVRDLLVRPVLQLPPEALLPVRGDGQELFSIVPDEQKIARLAPTDHCDVAFMLFTRGIKQGVYVVDLQIDYRLVYHEERSASTTRRLPIAVGVPSKRSGEVCPPTEPAPFSFDEIDPSIRRIPPKQQSVQPPNKGAAK